MCDTFVALSSVTSDGSVVFGKNSDREPNEAQALEYYPARTCSSGEKVRCTYLEIPQDKSTFAVLLSRPFWMWGAEMGANEKGLVIGNEAVFTGMPREKRSLLTGMDILRLALERASSSKEALELMIRLLSDYGQGGACGYEDKSLLYHNSYIIADPREAWVLETAGPLWAAIKVKDFYSISNGLTIGEQFDECHPELIETARERGWLKKGDTFHFAGCFSDWFYTTFSACRTRQRMSYNLIDKYRGEMNETMAMRILRDHRHEDYKPDNHFLMNRVCMHAANKLSRNGQSTGSLIAHLKPGLRTYWATGTSAPCTGIFKPIWFRGKVLPDIGPVPDGTYNPDTLWWYHEMLHRSVLLDYPARLEAFKKDRDKLEASFIKKAGDTGAKNRWAFSSEAFRRARDETGKWIASVRNRPVRRRPKLYYRLYWAKQNRKAGITVT